MSDNKNNDWLFEIKPKDSLIRLNLKEVWQYRDLLFLFVKRDVVTLYKQIVLGPLWYVIQPLITSLIFTLIFNNRGVYLATYDNFLITSTFTFHHSVN